MYTRTTTIINETGLHARPASDFTRKAAAFASDITACRMDAERIANAKSTVHILTLGLAKGAQIKISAEGPDEREAVDTLISLIDSGFAEEP